MFNMYMLASYKVIKMFHYKDLYLHKNNKINKKINAQV